MAVDGGLERFARRDLDEAQAAVAGLVGTELEISVCMNENGMSTVTDPRTATVTPRPGVTSVEQLLAMEQDSWGRCDQRILILWGHGDEPQPDANAALEARTVPEPGAVVDIFRRHSEWGLPTVIGYDACTMALADVVWELRLITEARPAEQMPVVVASQIDEPADGWPYRTLLGRLIQDFDIDANSFASIVVDTYAEQVKAAKDIYSIGAFDPSAVTGLKDAVSSLVSQQLGLRPKPRPEPIFTAIEVAQWPGVGDSTYDVKRLADLLVPGPLAGTIATALGPLTVAHRTDDDHRVFGGLSVVLPSETDASGADKLSSQFARESQWLRFWQECIAGQSLQ
ncbi:MAG: clostripain-related cysteine peptidase [Candidatus Nanopelagicales bacterium]